MFNKSELHVIGTALVMQIKSVLRMAAKPGQPDTVAAEYRKVSKQIDDLLKKVNGLLVDEKVKS